MLVSRAKDTHPQLDHIRFMLLFARIVGHPSSCMFASCKTLEDTHNYLMNVTLVRSAPKLNVSIGMSKQQFIDDTHYCIITTLKRDTRIGLRVWRNTGCLMAQLAKGDPNEIRKVQDMKHLVIGVDAKRTMQQSCHCQKLVQNMRTFY